jgi:hypothetical protein
VWWLPQREAIAPGAEAELGMAQLGLGTCPELWSDAGFELAGCAGVVLARLMAEPHGLLGSPQGGWLFGPALELRLARRLLGPAHAVLSATGQSLWPRHSVEYERRGRPVRVYRVAPVMIAAALSIELRF